MTLKKILLLLLFPLTVLGQKDYSSLLEQYMQAQVNVNSFSGSILVFKDQKQILKKAYGLADLEWNIANTVDTKYRIGSITKWFTATAILKLEEQGKLKVTDKLSKFFPDFPKGDSVTIHMLLNHSSGITDCFHLDKLNNLHFEEINNVHRLSFPKDSMLALLKSSPYDFSPGKGASYSNSGYFLLGLIIEKVSGQSYEEYLQQHIFKAADMQNSGVGRYDTILPNRAKGYRSSSSGFINAFNDEYRSDVTFALGSLYSTVDDMYKFDRALKGNSILSDASKNKMFSSYADHWGYGCVIDTFENRLRSSMTGWVFGFKSVIFRFTNNNTCIIVLANNELNPSGVATGLASIIFDLPIVAPYIHKEIKINPELLNNYVGQYVPVKPDNFDPIKIGKKDGKLYRFWPADDTTGIELLSESNSKFFYSDGSDRQIEFITDKKGKVTKVYLIKSGIVSELKKFTKRS